LDAIDGVITPDAIVASYADAIDEAEAAVAICDATANDAIEAADAVDMLFSLTTLIQLELLMLMPLVDVKLPILFAMPLILMPFELLMLMPLVDSVMLLMRS
jgi:hypothetical protein